MNLMFSHLHINENLDDEADFAVEFKISEFFNPENLEKYGHNLENLTLKDIKSRWEDVLLIFSQNFQRIFYLNTFDQIMTLYKLVFLQIEEFRDCDFSGLMPKDKHKNARSEGVTDFDPKLDGNDFGDFDKAHLFFMRKSVARYLEALDKGLGSMGMDYSMMLDNFSLILAKIRQVYPSLQVQILYGFSALIKSSHRRFN